ncbi:caspase recruitment domain-containing protein 10 isoform X1 [Oxyura jamaicensis]|uniref:caspase recruitment domain-containing protein 10 isoform X1 n=1 Tax=Oxyura jamaicensis TaxID=8884 RepID=UPI0015A72018|nr:caspase recruitment domain-containing protein 10 isoform X1 [Oxyura jamaicensis]
MGATTSCLWALQRRGCFSQGTWAGNAKPWGLPKPGRRLWRGEAGCVSEEKLLASHILPESSSSPGAAGGEETGPQAQEEPSPPRPALENASLRACSLSEQEEEEDAIWEKIESARHQLTRSLNPAKLTPYLRQCRVIDEQDEEEVLNSCRFPCKSNQTGYLMDILRRRGKRGYEAFLESLEFYYPEHYTRLTGREPAQRCSMILDEEGPEGLTQFLLMEVKKMRAQRKEHLLKEHQLQAKNQAMEQEQARLEQRLQELLKVQERCQRLREEWDSNSVELLRLKDENYMMAMRYAQLCEEKNMAVLRSRDLQLAVDQLKCKVTSLEEECSLLRKQAAMVPQREAEERGHPDTVSELWAENQRLMASLQELQGTLQAPGEVPVPGSEQILLDILEHDWKEAQDDRQDLCQKLNSLQSELQWAEELRDKYLQEVEDLQLKYRTLQKDCDLYKHRMNTVLLQLEEIEKERDQAIQSRDGVQLQYSQSLIEKDQYRKRVRALEEERDELLSKLSQAEGLNSTLEVQLQRCRGNRSLGKMCSSSYSLCSNLSSTWSLADNPAGFASGLVDALGDSAIQSMEVTPDSEKDINRLSTFPFPPCIGSILRRQREERCMPYKSLSCGSFSSIEDATGSGFASISLGAFSSSSSSTYARVKSEICLSTLPSRQEVTRRSLVVQLTSMGPASNLSPQEKSLGADISILGGNRTGIFVQWVKPGSQVENTGLREGCRLIELRVPSLKEEVLSLENCTREVAYLSLLHWEEPSSLVFQLDLQGYQPLREALEEGKKFSGDSFYVRTNLPLLESSDPYALCVKCREILHVTDTMHKGRLEWYCSRVDPLTMRDLDKGTVPNYSRAHQLLKIQEKSHLPGQPKSHRNNLKKRALDQLRLVKSKPQKSPGQPPQQLWLDPCSDPDRSLKPYSLVHPVVVKTPRPVVLSPNCIAPRLIRNLLDLPTSRLDFHVCPAEKLAEEHPSAQEPSLSKSGPQEWKESGQIRMIREAMEKNKHCLLELGVQSVRDLIKHEIYPIVIHIEVTEKNVRGLRSLLGKPGQRDTEVLKVCRGAERALHALPCSWARVEPHAWSHVEELPKVVRGCIFQEQTRPLWVEDGDD